MKKNNRVKVILRFMTGIIALIEGSLLQNSGKMGRFPPGIRCIGRPCNTLFVGNGRPPAGRAGRDRDRSVIGGYFFNLLRIAVETSAFRSRFTWKGFPFPGYLHWHILDDILSAFMSRIDRRFFGSASNFSGISAAG